MRVIDILVFVLAIAFCFAAGYVAIASTGNAAVAALSSFVVWAIWAVAYTYWRLVRPLRVERRLLRSGEVAEAYVEQVRDVSLGISGTKRKKLLLEVRPVGRPPFKGEARVFVQSSEESLFQPGGVIPVRYDPGAPRLVAVEILKRDLDNSRQA